MALIINKAIYNNDETYVYERLGYLYKIDGDLYQNYSLTVERIDKGKVKLLPPHNPKNIIGVGTNYKAMIKDESDTPREPIIFLKPVTTITYEENIPYPNLSNLVKAEVELAVVMGRKCKEVKEEEAESYILGYTTAMDFTAVDKLVPSAIWNVSKMFDGFTPLGTFLVKDIDISNLKVTLNKNSKTVVNSSTEGMIFSIPYLISYISKIMTLMPGDIILTGTPWEAIEIVKGDSIEAEIQGIGKIVGKIV